MKVRRSVWRQITFACLALAIPTSAWCSNFMVSPVRIQVSAQRPNAILKLTNRDDQPVTLQIHVVTWGFDGQKDVYADSDDVMLNPPIATLAPHQTQFIRLGLRHAVEGAEERSYRLIVDEVPPPPQPGFSGIRTLVRLSIPVFAMPKTATAPRISWQALRNGDSSLRLVASNQGNAHVAIRSLEVTGTETPDAYLNGVPPAYLLPRNSANG